MTNCNNNNQTWNEQLFEMIGRMRQNRSNSRAAAVVTLCQMMVGNNPNRNKSKASVVVKNIIKVKEISDFISSNGTL